ncbi:MAG: ligase-associated DNA damage response exonuclease [Devosiaceae bacterium]|nr:ligase-associated DNA damage response exonuclease [Devosiaceae bacterium MH13]
MALRADQFMTLRPEGLYCVPGDFFIDPVRPVPRALITHGHADHARPGHGAVLATAETLQIMAIRYGAGFTGTSQSVELGEVITLGDTRVSFHPAGHVLGSAQICVEHQGHRLVASGDYKRHDDPTVTAFEVVPCDTFITEATFGLPVFRHPPGADEVAKLVASLSLFPDRPHLVGAYALGKAQRVIAEVRAAGYDAPIYLHGAMEKLCAFYQAQGVDLGDLRPVAGLKAKDVAGQIIVCPPGSMADRWAQKFGDTMTCFASGWMRVRARARQRGVELPLVMSDHADWDDLCRTIVETGAADVWVTHGQEDALVHWCGTQGIAARPLNMIGYGDDDEAASQDAAA